MRDPSANVSGLENPAGAASRSIVLTHAESASATFRCRAAGESQIAAMGLAKLNESSLFMSGDRDVVST